MSCNKKFLDFSPHRWYRYAKQASWGVSFVTQLPVNLDVPPIQIEHSGSLLPVIVRHVLDRIDWQPLWDALLPYDAARTQVAPSWLLLALVLNVLCHREPMVHVQQWWAEQWIDQALAPGIRADQLNDDALGRVLERVAQVGPALVDQTCLRILTLFGDPKSLHNDTGSLRLWGTYDHPEPTDPITITYGHSKDHRDDLKQMLLTLSVTDRDLIASGQMASGNLDDKTWHADWVQHLGETLTLEQLRSVLYVGDSSFVTPKAVERADALPLRWLSRVPRIYGWVPRAVDTAWNQADQWKAFPTDANPTDASPTDFWQAVPETESVIGSVTVHAILVYSTALEAQKRHTLGRRWETQRTQGENALARAHRAPFASEAAARQAAEAWIAQHAYPGWILTAAVTSQVVPGKRLKRGRPAAHTPPPAPTTVYRLAWTWSPDDAYRQHRLQQASTLVLATSDRTLSPADMLTTYREEYKVEHGIRWLKSPLHLDPVYLKNSDRVAGFGYVAVLALAIARLLQALVREALVDQVPLRLPEGRAVDQPSDRVLLRLLDVPLLALKVGSFPLAWRPLRSMHPSVDRVCRLLHLNLPALLPGYT